MKSHRIIVFDGVCVLCSDWVRFVMRRDRPKLFQFAAMQTDRGRALLTAHGIDPDDPVTFLLVEDDRHYTDTDAALRVIREFHFGWQALAAALRVIPRFLRNALYRWIARNRYRLFGRREICFLPSAADADRFLK